MPAPTATAESSNAATPKTSVFRQALGRIRSGIASIGRRLDTPGKKAGSAVAVAVVVGFIAWVAFREPTVAPADKLQQALELLQDRENLDDRQQARELALGLSRAGYRDPDFAGGVEFILGIVAFRTALDADEMRKEQHFIRAARKLRECERRALIAKFRPEWTYALGVSLHELGNASAAMPLLKESLTTYPPGRNDAAVRVMEITLEQKSAAEWAASVKLAADLLRDRTLSQRERDRVLLDKSQLHVALNQFVEAQRALQAVSDTRAGSHAARVFRARTRMASADLFAARPGLSAPVDAVLKTRAVRRYRAALVELEPVANSIGLETTFPRQARLLMGICALRIAELDSEEKSAARYDAAINYFEQTSRDYPNSHEAVAAGLYSGELLRLSGRDEESLKSYRRAIQSAARSEEYHNRWVSSQEIQAALFRAWNDWMDRRSYPMAIQLAAMMPPIVAKPRAQELNALAHAEWAKQLAATLKSRPVTELPALRKELLRRYRLTGQSYEELAKLVSTTDRHPEYVKLSAEYYDSGHDYEKSLKQYSEFINTRPKREIARAIVRRGRVLMNLDRLKEALEEFAQVRDSFPKDPAAFDATYLTGVCLLDLGRPDQAEAVWKGILSSPRLTPEAVEWRMSLFSLGRQLFHSGRMLQEEAARIRESNPRQSRTTREAAATRLEIAATRISEYLNRYPRSRETSEARFLLAKALQCSAAIENEKLDEGEVENVRNEHRRRRNALLKRAETRYRSLQSDLLKLEEADRLETPGQSLLRDCCFEIAHTCFAQEEYDKAVLAYTNAANRYSKDAQVLLAYLQMANCSERLGDPQEAMSLVIQAEVILKQLPQTAFDPRLTALTRTEWAKWLEWTRQQRTASLK